MQEQEIKLSVPVSARKAIATTLSATGQKRIRLRAMYFDTPDRQLARQHAAIRLRQEGRKWVQTFKMAGKDALTRVELNHPRTTPQLDLSVYAGTPAETVFAHLKGDLALRYETDVWRTRCEIRTRTGTVEAAYDDGFVRAGDLELPLHEVEFELMSGRVGALFTLAKKWTVQHKLVLDVRSKAERGDRLANAAAAIAAAPDAERVQVRQEEIARYWAPTMAGKVTLAPRATPGQALDIITAECFDQIVRNAASLSGIDSAVGAATIGAEHVHQLRVGMRRLRSAWRLFKGWAPLPDDAAQEAAADYFGQFGEARDGDVLGETVVPLLTAAGMPPVALPQSADAPDAAVVAASPPFQTWLLDLLAWNVGVRPEPTPLLAPMTSVVAVPLQPGKLATPVVKRLKKWDKRLVEDGRRFHRLEDEARHDLRKLAKRLRYGLSFTESLFDADHVKPYRKCLSVLQDALGEINDLVVARETYLKLAETQPPAWFAVGWIGARLDVLYKGAEAEFKALDDTKPFWK